MKGRHIMERPDARLAAELELEQQKAVVQRLVSKITEVCWEKCTGTPGSSFSSRETACLSNCAKRFLDAHQYVMKKAESYSRH